MSTAKGSIWQSLLVISMSLALPLSAVADEKYDLLKQQVEVLKSQLEQVQETLKQYENDTVSKEEISEIKQEISEAAESFLLCGTINKFSLFISC